MRTFDCEAFKAKWRQLAAARGIDPVEGATSYQVALVKAEQMAARRRLDLMGYETSLYDAADEARDSTEHAAWERLNTEAMRRQYPDQVLIDKLTLRDIYPEVAREFAAERMAAALRELKARPVQFALALQ